MITDQWYLGLLAGMFTLNLLVTYRLYRLRHGSASEGGETSADAWRSDPVDHEAGTVTCTACETENELGYRYCRSCVEELPGATSFQRAGTAPLRRMTR